MPPSPISLSTLIPGMRIRAPRLWPSIRAATDLGEPLQAVAAAEHVVEDHHVVGAERERLPGHVAGERVVLLDLGPRPLLLQVMREEVSQVLVVVDDQDAHGRTRAAASFIHDLDPGQIIAVLGDARLERGAVAAARAVLDLLAQSGAAGKSLRCS